MQAQRSRARSATRERKLAMTEYISSASMGTFSGSSVAPSALKNGLSTHSSASNQNHSGNYPQSPFIFALQTQSSYKRSGDGGQGGRRIPKLTMGYGLSG
jgi:hypothetical protein